jgi:D-glycero-alpha-D-manno-heptose 1-phosphate guanylyltransferase
MSTAMIILAGGLGTRLRSAVPDLPKCMAPVNGKPFLVYVMEGFIQQGITDYILSLGYKSEAVIDYLEQHTFSVPVNLQYSIEQEPLGTGGAVKKALSLTNGKEVLVTNGDTLFTADVSQLQAFHQSRQADCTLALKPMFNFDRYGVVALDEEGRITLFKEKQWYEQGNINGGLYLLNKEIFLSHALPEKFSFEKDYLEAYTLKAQLYGQVQEAYFIDIGIPEDYERAGKELKQHAGN